MLVHYLSPSGAELLLLNLPHIPREGDRVTLADERGLSQSYFVESVAWLYPICGTWHGPDQKYGLRQAPEVYVHLFRPRELLPAYERD